MSKAKSFKYVIFAVAELIVVAAAALTPVMAINASADEWVNAAAEPNSNQRILPIIMYHQILNSRRSDYIVTEKTFKNDLIELKERGYETVFPSEVIAFVEGRGMLPAKPIMITFDDGHFNNIFYGQKLLEKHGCKAVLNIVGKYSDFSTTSGDHSNPSYSHITWEQLQDAAMSGVFEIGNHTFNLHGNKPRKGIGQKMNESEAEYRKSITEDIMKLQTYLKEKSGVTAQCFAYPFGKYNNMSERVVLEMGFKMIFTCYEMRNMITLGSNTGLHRLCRFNRFPKHSSANFFDIMERSRIKEYVKS